VSGQVLSMESIPAWKVGSTEALVKKKPRGCWGSSRGFSAKLSHDGVNAKVITGKKYEDHLRDAGSWSSEPPVRNQGRGAAMMRVEAVRRIFPKCWFNEAITADGLDCLGYYHEKRDEQRLVGLGPEHDFSSHAADAFGLMAVSYRDPSSMRTFHAPIEYPKISVA
jgi:phage terminase large subunit